MCMLFNLCEGSSEQIQAWRFSKNIRCSTVESGFIICVLLTFADWIKVAFREGSNQRKR